MLEVNDVSSKNQAQQNQPRSLSTTVKINSKLNQERENDEEDEDDEEEEQQYHT